jgi:hypothetical protein
MTAQKGPVLEILFPPQERQLSVFKKQNFELDYTASH